MAIITTDGLGIQLAGRCGNVVYSQTRDGITMRDYVVPHNPRTPLQQAGRNLFGRASQHWKALDATERAAWIAYAAGLPATSKSGGVKRTPAPHRVYIGLGRKFLAVNPGVVALSMPPERPFFGDTITVSATADNGQLVFTSDAPNAPHIVTEFWLQPLANEFRRPIGQRYRLKGYTAFAVGGLAVSIPVVRGVVYAPAYRFVNRLTGQETPLALLPPVTVSGEGCNRDLTEI